MNNQDRWENDIKHNFTQYAISFIMLVILMFLSPVHAGHKMVEIETTADVLDAAKAGEFFKIPELKAVNGELKVHLYINEQRYLFAGDEVKLRTYTYESGEFSSTKIGPWGPTMRIGENDRLSVTIHNSLPAGADLNYLGSLSTSNADEFDKGGPVSEELKTVIVNATIHADDDPLITYDNLVDANIEVVEGKQSWIIHGKVAKVPIEYPVERLFNYGSEKEALRIYEKVGHSGEEHDHNTPHGFNTSNFHTHGFHVSPSQDDIFRKIAPGFSSYYTYDLVNHTPGTMWYHPHVHGSTALQVASGMSGAIIIEDDDLSKYKDLATASTPEHERILLLNQIFFDETTGELSDFNTLLRSDAPNGTTINGIVLPTMKINPGEVQRWRLIHSGYQSTLGLEFPKETEVWQIAVDGIMFDVPIKLETVHMVPGNRTDLLVYFPKNTERGTYSVKSIEYNSMCEYFPQNPECGRNTENDTEEETIISILLEGNAMDMKVPTDLPGPGDKHRNISRNELINPDKPRKTEFNIVDGQYLVNGKAFEADVIPNIVTLGTAEQWVVSSESASHPYHIHTNPFQVVTFAGRELKPPMWKDVVMVTTEYDAVMRTRYQQYWGDLVLHCHILHHEDQGMMQRVRIERPDKGRLSVFEKNNDNN